MSDSGKGLGKNETTFTLAFLGSGWQKVRIFKKLLFDYSIKGRPFLGSAKQGYAHLVVWGSVTEAQGRTTKKTWKNVCKSLGPMRLIRAIDRWVIACQRTSSWIASVRTHQVTIPKYIQERPV